MLSKLRTKLAVLWQRRFYYLSRQFRATVPVHSISWVPDGFTSQRLGNTGVRLVSNFATADECAAVLTAGKARLERMGASVLVNNVAESGALNLAGSGPDDALLLPLLHRSAILFGLSYTHVEKLVLLRVTADSEHDLINHYAPAFDGGPHHAVLAYLNDLPAEAVCDTRFAGMNLAISPQAGRAVCWSLGAGLSANNLGVHESMPESASQEKWILQIWFGARPLRADNLGMLNPPQARQGLPLAGDEHTPDGVWAPQDIDLEAVFGQPDKMKGLL